MILEKPRLMRKRCSTSPPGVHSVDGLPPVLNTEAVWVPHGWFGPAPIHALDQKRIEIIENVSAISQTSCSSFRLYMYASYGWSNIENRQQADDF